MVIFELEKVNDSFDKLTAALKETDLSSLSSLYETLLPWYQACNEIQYPQLYTLFTGDEETFLSWDEIEDYLPYMSLKKVTKNKIVIEAEDELMHTVFLLHLAILTESNLTLISESELHLSGNYRYDDVKFMMKLNNIDFSLEDNIVKLKHMKR